jgi:multicomponent K+:H+ antiporter subunit E
VKRVPIALSAALLLVWFLLDSTFTIGHTVLGVALSVTLAVAAGQLRPLQPHLRRADVAVKLLARVFVDVVQSNIGVARIVLGLTGKREIHSGFMVVPLELRDPHGLAVLAMIVTSTPGTVWQGLSADRSELTIHVLDLVEEAYWVRKIKQRYEQPLRNIFE